MLLRWLVLKNRQRVQVRKLLLLLVLLLLTEAFFYLAILFVVLLFVVHLLDAQHGLMILEFLIGKHLSLGYRLLWGRESAVLFLKRMMGPRIFWI